MLLSEAARSGRKFWRKSEPTTLFWLEGKQIRYGNPTGGDGLYFLHQGFNAEELTAQDWDVEPKSIMITAKDLRSCIVQLGSKTRRPDEIVNLIIEELEL